MRNAQKADKTPVGENLLKFPIFSYIRVYGMHRSRRYQDLNAEIDIGRLSADLCHFANISYRLGGQLLKLNPRTERFESNEANQLAHPAHRAPYIIPNLVEA